jgi:hypothetical protein
MGVWFQKKPTENVEYNKIKKYGKIIPAALIKKGKAQSAFPVHNRLISVLIHIRT